MCRKFLFCTLRQNTGNVLHLQCNCSEQCCQDFDVYVNSSVSFERLKDIHWKKVCRRKKWKIEILHRAEGEGRESFEPVACQPFCVFLCEEMRASSLFLLHTMTPLSLGKPAAQVGKSLRLWTLKGEWGGSYLAFELSQHQHTQQALLSSVHENKK